MLEKYENAKKLVKALRSGKYKQGIGSLHPDKNTFCCLGVGCDQYRLENQADNWHKNNSVGGIFQFLGHGSVLPDEVRDWLGFASDDGSFIDDNGCFTSLAALNDGYTSFEDIADIIEKEPRGLFIDAIP